MDKGDFVKQHKGGSLAVKDQFIECRKHIKDPPKSRSVTEQRESLNSLVVAHNKKITAQYNGFTSSYDRHKKYMTDLVHYYGKSVPRAPEGENDYTILEKNFQFIRDEYQDEIAIEDGNDKEQYEAKISLAYYQKLHKEYALADLSRFETGQVGLTWRTEDQVISGKGQFICGNIECLEKSGLKEFELDFVYKEGGLKKNELVKVALCVVCAYKLNYRRIKDKEKAEKKAAKKRKREDKTKSNKRHKKE